jgi:hypothetical protein
VAGIRPPGKEGKMKKLVALAVAALTLTVGATAALARGDADPLFEDSGFLCGVFDRDGTTVLATTNSYLVWRKNGTVYLRCEASGTGGNSILVTKGELCGLGPFGSTTDTIRTARRNGQIQLECWGYADPAPARLAAAGSYGN